MPNLVVIAGPNGAGKSTAAPLLLGDRLRVGEFVNADVIAAGLSAFSPERVSLEAGRIMLRRLEELAMAQRDFAFETTLASRGFARWIAALRRDRNYRFHLFFFWLPSVDQAIERVARRARMGGHSIPADVIRRRYERGIRNFMALYSPIADSWEIHDNSVQAQLIARKREGAAPHIANERVWQMIESQAKAREREELYEAAPDMIMGVPFGEILEALQEAGREARRRHKALGHPIVIWRDGRVAEVPPEEIEV